MTDLANTNLEELIALRETARARVTEVYPKWRRAQEITTKLNEQYQAERATFEEIEREIALHYLELEEAKQRKATSEKRSKSLSPEAKVMAMLAKMPADQREAILSAQRKLLAHTEEI